MHTVFVFQGSELLWARAEGDGLRLRFAAASARQQACANAPALEGHLVPLEWLFERAQWQVEADANESLGDCMGALAHGELHGPSLARARELALPWAWTGEAHDAPLQAEFTLRQGATLRVQAQAAHIALTPGWRFVESLAC